MNKIEVRLYSSLRKYNPNPASSESFIIEFDDKAKLGNILDKLKIPGEEVGVLMVNGSWEKESYLLQDGDRIGISPLIGGG
ncbi:MoaD/ThiS family protein [Chloroflexota bacterium]